MTEKKESNLILFETPKYYICFHNTNRWYRRFLKNGFQHCFLLINDGIQWMEVSPTLNQCNVIIIPFAGDEENKVMEFYFKRINKFSVIEVIMRNDFIPRSWVRIPSCVSIIKYIMGIRLRSFTPYSFYKHLLRLNRHIVKEVPDNPKNVIIQLKELHGIKSVRKIENPIKDQPK